MADTVSVACGGGNSAC